MDIKIIGMEEGTFYRMVEEAVSCVREKLAAKEDRWIDGKQAMKKLRITSKTTLQKFRDEGRIRKCG